MAFNSDPHALLKAMKKASQPVADAIEREKAKLQAEDGVIPMPGSAKRQIESNLERTGPVTTGPQPPNRAIV